MRDGHFFTRLVRWSRVSGRKGDRKRFGVRRLYLWPAKHATEHHLSHGLRRLRVYRWPFEIVKAMQADGLDWGEVIVLVAVKGWRRSSKVRWPRWSSAIPTGLRSTMLPIARNAYYRRIFDVRRGAEGQGPASSEPRSRHLTTAWTSS
jgi:hypothetical protein